jgi:hypothetical protein
MSRPDYKIELKVNLPSGTEKNCDLDGMICLKAAHRIIRILKNPWDESGDGISCTCMIGCEELKYKLFEQQEQV